MNKFFRLDRGSVMLLLMLLGILAIVVPLPKQLIDIALVTVIAFSATIYLRAGSIKSWDELSSLPSLLLVTAIFRISLNVSTTRRILTDGDPGVVIEAFGNFVVGSNVAIGLVVFVVLIAVQYILSNNASRTAEVSARFTLDAMPGKQLSIDADLQQRYITEEQAREKRKKLEMEVDYYGHMDGAGKLIKGDVLLGIILIFVNIIAGFIIGVVTKGMSVTDALQHYTLLTVGDGVINQISSLLITGASGLVMTRVDGGKNKNVMQSIISEMTNNPKVIAIVGLFSLVLSFIPGLPFLPFFGVSVAIFFVAYRKQRKFDQEEKEEKAKQILESQEMSEKEAERVEVITEIQPITLEIGVALVPVVETEREGETLKDKITMMRKNIAKELGVRIPQIHVLDNSALMPYTKYNILIKDSPVATGDLKVNHFLALKTPLILREVNGIPTKDPIFGEEALWITEDIAEEAKAAGYTVLDPLSILSTHLNEMVRRNLHELVQRQEVQNMLENVKIKHQVILDEIKQKNVDLSVIQKVIKNLLRENISVRDLPTILEAVIDSKNHEKIDDVTSEVRERISKYICEKNKSENDGKLNVILLNPELEKDGVTAIKNGEYQVKMTVLEERGFIESLIEQIQKAHMSDIEPVLLTGRYDLRAALARLVHKYSIPISVLSANELVAGIPIERIGVIEYENQGI